jgi:hypothetical protein
VWRFRLVWARIALSSLALILGSIGYWAGGLLGAGIGTTAGGLVLLWFERIRRRVQSATRAQPDWLESQSHGVASLLDPALAVVPFIGRHPELAALREWCLDQSGGPLRLILGGQGVGKTRLALELCREMTEYGWRCLHVAEGHEHEVLTVMRRDSTSESLLLVVDYAETRINLGSLLKAIGQDVGLVRVLLLARRAGEWWDRLNSSEAPRVRYVVADANRAHVELSDELEPGVSAIEVIRWAIPSFASRLNVPAPQQVQVIVSEVTRIRVLELHAAALIAVLRAQEPPSSVQLRVTAGEILDDLLRHESHYWIGRAQAVSLLAGPSGLSMKQLRQVVAVECLLGAADRDEAMTYSGMSRASHCRKPQRMSWHCGCEIYIRPTAMENG